MLLRWLTIGGSFVAAITLIAATKASKHWGYQLCGSIIVATALVTAVPRKHIAFLPANCLAIALLAGSGFKAKELEKHYENVERVEDTLNALKDTQIETELYYLAEKVRTRNQQEQDDVDLDNQIRKLEAIAPLLGIFNNNNQSPVQGMVLGMLQNGASIGDAMLAVSEARMQLEQLRLQTQVSVTQAQAQQVQVTQQINPVSQTVDVPQISEMTAIAVSFSARQIETAASVNKIATKLIREDKAPNYRRLIYSLPTQDFASLPKWKNATKLALGFGDKEPLPMYIYGAEQIAVEVPVPDSERQFFDFPQRAWKQGERLVVIGQSLDGEILIDLGYEDTPQLLVAGTTGSGKSNFLRGAAYALLMQGARVDICGGKVSDYEDFTERFDSITMNDMGKTFEFVGEYYQECDRRNGLSKAELAAEPAWILIIDEYKGTVPIDERKKLYDSMLSEVTRRGRGLKIHVIIGLQRGSKRGTNDPEGLPPDLKDNLPCRIAFKMSDPMGSRMVLMPGERSGLAASLKGRGDGIIQAGSLDTRFQAYRFTEIPNA